MKHWARQKWPPGTKSSTYRRFAMKWNPERNIVGTGEDDYQSRRDTRICLLSDQQEQRKMAKRLTGDQWSSIRQQYETDPRLSFGDLAGKFGISKQAIHKRATVEKWERTLSLAELNVRAHTRADRLVDGQVDAQALASARKAGIEEATDRRAAVLDRHRKELDGPRKLVYQAILSGDLDKAKLAKTLADTLRITHELERKAWGLDAGENGASVIVIDRR